MADANRGPVSRRGMEKMMADLEWLMAEQDFASVEEANAFLNQFMAGGREIPSRPSTTPLDRAQDLMYEAWDAPTKEEGVAVAHQALELSEDCADAYVLLAE